MFLSGLIATILLLLIFYIVGFILAYLTKATLYNNIYYNIFVNLILGVLTTALAISVIYTRGNTIHISLFTIAILYYLFKPKQNLDNTKSIAKANINNTKLPLITITIIGLLIYFFYASLYFDKPFDNILHFDEVYYAYVSSNIGNYGIETLEPVFSFKNNSAATPYHYTELWLSYFISATFNLNSLFVISVVVKTLFTSILLAGMFALTQFYTNNKLLFIVAFLGILIAPILLDYNNIKQAACNAHQSKFMIAASLYIWSIILYHNKSTLTILPLLILPIVNIAFAPVVLPVLSAITIALLFYKHEFLKFKHLSIGIASTTLIIASFYILQPEDISKTALEISEILPFYNFSFFINDTIRHIKNVAMYGPYFLPLLILVAYNFIFNKSALLKSLKPLKAIIIYLVLAFITGNIIEFLFYPFAGYDAGQINAINYFILLNLLVFISFIVVYINLKPKYIRSLTLIFIGIVLGYNIIIFGITRKNMTFSPKIVRSEKYISDVCNYLKDYNKNPIGATILADSEIRRKDKSWSRGELMNGYWFTPYSTEIDHLQVHNLNTLTDLYKDYKNENIKLNSQKEREEHYLKLLTDKNTSIAAFTQFVKQESQKNDSLQLDTLQYLFAKKEHLSFLVLSNGVQLPHVFINRIDTVFVDEITNESFVFIENMAE